MKKSVIAIVWTVVLCIPCLLVFDGGAKAPEGEESLQWTNVFGLVWFGFLVLDGFRLITPKWMRNELKAYMNEEDE